MKKYIPHFSLLFLLFYATTSLGQTFDLTGIVKDEQDRPIAFATVVLQTDESTIIQGTITEDTGIFTLSNVVEGTYKVGVSFIGFTTYESEVFTLSRKRTLQPIILTEAPETLDEVTIVGRKPTITKRADGLVFNVENSTLSQNNSFDILRRTPSILVVNGDIKVRNQNATVYINDRRVYLSGQELQELLEAYDGSNIKEIEVLTNPGARYDAEGGLVVNIKTSKSIAIGYKGNANARYTQGIFAKYALSTSHYYKTKNANYFASYSFNPRKENKDIESFINFFDGGTPAERWEDDFNRITRSQAHNLNTIFDFTVGERSSLSITSNVVFSPNRTFDNTSITTASAVNNQPIFSFLSESDLAADNLNANFGLEHKASLRNGETFRTSLNYIVYDADQDQALATTYFDAAGVLDRSSGLELFSRQRTNIFTGQLDFTATLAEEVAFETGFKYSNINSNSEINYGGSFGANLLDDNFDYDEQIIAYYGSLNKDFNKWSLYMGLRAEYTDIKAQSIALNENNDQQYLDVFPNATVGYTPHEHHSFSVYYKRSVDRARYQSLNPFRYYLNEATFNTGNPNLTRALSNTYGLDYTYKGMYFFSLYYQSVSDYLDTFAFQNNASRTLRNVEANAQQWEQYSFDFTYGNSVTSWWYVSTYFSGAYMRVTFDAIESINRLQEIDTPLFLGQVFNRFWLSKDRTLTSDVSLFYLSNFIAGSALFENQFYADISFRKSLWRNRGALTLTFSDVSNGTNVPLVSRYQNQDNGFFAMPERRLVAVGFQYKFGNFKLSDNERDTKAKEQERLEKSLF